MTDKKETDNIDLKYWKLYILFYFLANLNNVYLKN